MWVEVVTKLYLYMRNIEQNELTQCLIENGVKLKPLRSFLKRSLKHYKKTLKSNPITIDDYRAHVCFVQAKLFLFYISTPS